MESVKISRKFQVVIPRSVREKLHLVAGQRMQVVAYGNLIELIPEREIAEMGEKGDDLFLGKKPKPSHRQNPGKGGFKLIWRESVTHPLPR